MYRLITWPVFITGFVSKSLSDAERNYAIHDKELLSVIWGLEEWRHILEGTKHKIEILNDHQNLTYFRSAQNLNRRQARWSLYLSRFDFELIHRPGRHSAKPDALSRRADHKRGEEDNQNQTLLGPELFHVDATTTEVAAQLASGEGNEFLDCVRNCSDQDEAVVKALKKLGTSRSLRGEEWSEENGLILYRNKVYIVIESGEVTYTSQYRIHIENTTISHRTDTHTFTMFESTKRRTDQDSKQKIETHILGVGRHTRCPRDSDDLTVRPRPKDQ